MKFPAAWSDIPTASVRSVGALHAMLAPPPARPPVAVKETILECGQTTSVSMPSALFFAAEDGAGLFLNRAGTVKERRVLFSRGGACSGVLEGATGEDMVGHTVISNLRTSFYVFFKKNWRYRGRRTYRTVRILCVLAVESLLR